MWAVIGATRLPRHSRITANTDPSAISGNTNNGPYPCMKPNSAALPTAATTIPAFPLKCRYSAPRNTDSSHSGAHSTASERNSTSSIGLLPPMMSNRFWFGSGGAPSAIIARTAVAISIATNVSPIPSR